MSAIKPDEPLTIRVTSRNDMERKLDNAVATLRAQAAPQRRCGIFVTRQAVDRFTVALSDTVPFGLTMEKLEW